jgi:PAS domain S-box-containing protein
VKLTPVQVGVGLCVAGAAVGLIVLAGWATGTHALTTLSPVGYPMMPSTAAGVLLAALGGALRGREGRWATLASLAAGAIALAIGSTTLAGYLMGDGQLGIDRILLHAGRPAPPGALAVTLLGGALVVFDVQRPRAVRPAEWLAVAVALLALVTLAASVPTSGLVHRLARAPAMGASRPASIALLLTAIGLLLLRPADGLMAISLSPGPGGMLMRRLGVGIVLGPPLLGLLVALVVRRGGEQMRLAIALSTTLVVPFGLALVAVTATRLDRAHHALERQLSDARDFLDNVLQSSVGYGIVALDLRRRVVLWNAGARRNHGYDPTEVIGLPVDRLHVPDDLASGVAHALYAAALDRGSAEAVMSLRRKDGAQFIAQVVLARRLGHDGAPIGYLMVSRDASVEQQQADHERLLAEAGMALASTLDERELIEQFARLVVRHVADACIVDLLDGDDSCYHVVRHRDPRQAPVAEALQQLGIDRTRPHLSWSALERRRPVLVSHVTAEYLETIAQSPEHLRLMLDLGLVAFMAVPIVVREQGLGAVVLASSTPGRHYGPADLARAEELVRRLSLALDNARLYDAAQKAIAGRDAVVGVVAHDLRTPLTAARLAADMLLVRPAQEDRRGSTRRVAERIQRSLRTTTRLIDDLLDVSKIDAGQLTVTPRGCCPSDLTRDALDLLAPVIAAASLQIDVQVEPTAPLVWADAGRIVQVLSNLLANAVKFVPSGGHVHVRVTRQRGMVQFAVADNGPGIAPEHLPHVFDRFWQAGTGDRRGAGLGLAICKAIVDAHGGDIWVESPGQGTTFYFTLRVAAAIGEQPPCDPAALTH